MRVIITLTRIAVGIPPATITNKMRIDGVIAALLRHRRAAPKVLNGDVGPTIELVTGALRVVPAADVGSVAVVWPLSAHLRMPTLPGTLRGHARCLAR